MVIQDALLLNVEHKQTSCMLLSVGDSMLRRERNRATKEKREWGGLHGRKTHWRICLGLRKLFYSQNLFNVIRARESVLRNAQISAASPALLQRKCQCVPRTR